MPSCSPLRRRQRRASGGIGHLGALGIGHLGIGYQALGIGCIRQWALGFGLWALGFGLWALGFGDWVSGIGRVRGPVPVGQPRCCLPPGGCAQPGTLHGPAAGRQRPGLRHAWTRAAAAARMIRRALIRTPRHHLRPRASQQPSRARGRAPVAAPGTRHWRAGVGNDTVRGRQAALRSTTIVAVVWIVLACAADSCRRRVSGIAGAQRRLSAAGAQRSEREWRCDSTRGRTRSPWRGETADHPAR